MGQAADADTRRIRVFYAEDNDTAAALLARRLRDLPNWSLVRARTRAEAAAMLQGDRFDVAVLDYQLPDGDGLELLEIARARAPETPVLFLTAHGSEEVALRALALGASDYMQKSATLADELPGRIEALLERAADLREAARVVPATRSMPRRAPAPPPKDMDGPIARFVKGDVRGAAIFDSAGRPLATRLPDGLDPAMLGASLFQIHAQVGVLGRLTGLTPLRYVFQLDVEGAALASSTLPLGIIVILMDPNATTDQTCRRLVELAHALKE